MEVIISSVAKKQIKKLSKLYQTVIVLRLKKIENETLTDVTKLVGYKNVFRTRVGDYRIVYEIKSKKAFIISIGHRKDIYKLLDRLFS